VRSGVGRCRNQPAVGRIIGGWKPVTDAALLDCLPSESQARVVQVDLKALVTMNGVSTA